MRKTGESQHHLDQKEEIFMVKYKGNVEEATMMLATQIFSRCQRTSNLLPTCFTLNDGTFVLFSRLFSRLLPRFWLLTVSRATIKKNVVMNYYSVTLIRKLSSWACPPVIIEIDSCITQTVTCLVSHPLSCALLGVPKVTEPLLHMH